MVVVVFVEVVVVVVVAVVVVAVEVVVVVWVAFVAVVVVAAEAVVAVAVVVVFFRGESMCSRGGRSICLITKQLVPAFVNGAKRRFREMWSGRVGAWSCEGT